jgi:hypothetical protein
VRVRVRVPGSREGLGLSQRLNLCCTRS